MGTESWSVDAWGQGRGYWEEDTRAAFRPMEMFYALVTVLGTQHIHLGLLKKYI